jgi:hypothetical protein
MSDYTFADGFTNDFDGWSKAVEKTMAVPSYKRFLEVTSSYSLMVVENNPNLTKVNDRNQCHENCRLAELEGIGKRISGWFVMNEFIYKEYGTGMMRLVHHSNLLLPDGTYINPTLDLNRTHHIFLRDDKRHFDFEKLIGYNDRMVFGDSFMVGRDHFRAVPRNKVLFAAEEEYDRDLYYEKFRVHKTPEEVFNEMPKGLTNEQKQRWLKLKSSARFGP